ncbi:palmitoyltransferase ZDHHC23 [Spea bombifrons]|uniref:palmitoyltransferase ZDHHC23 n=1 Tax=Spea bombifrons TaxID=233779 RepID=UPI00234967C3|nr:palmitoyltransferase ZDHHC23 [Spea bombifrons]
MGVKGNRKPPAGGDTDEGLCCCEYINRRGERSHLAACLCDCEDLDRACDRWITCKSLEPEVLARAVETASDRFRVPWIRGARRVDVSVVPPLVLLPVCLHIAALHAALGLVVLTSLPVLVLWYYRLTHRRKGKSLLFLSLALFSLGYMYNNFMRDVYLQGLVGTAHFTLITCGVLLTVFFLAKAKQDPGYLAKPTGPTPEAAGEFANGAWTSGAGKEGIDGEEKGIAGKKWCDVCRVVKPPRSGHCRICGCCVRRLDHHCVWIDNCIGERNHAAFLLLLALFTSTSVFGIAVTLRATCRGQSILTALIYCPGVYAQYSTSFTFTCVWYCAIVTAGTGYILLLQLINISYNATEREARIALRRKTGRCLLGGLIVDPVLYNQGFVQNWAHFLTMGSPAARRDVTDLV